MVADTSKRTIPGILYLVPVPLGGNDPSMVIPEKVIDITHTLNCFIAENAKSARQFLKSIMHPIPLNEITVLEIDKHAKQTDFSFYFNSIRSGINTGLVSEAGIPSVADPGSPFVLQAHREKIKVIPLSGPSSIILALAASGLNGQNFVFHGYLPKEKSARHDKIRQMEAAARKFRQTQIFIETPYRNQAVLEDLIHVCAGNTMLCVASDITLPTESIMTASVAEWKQKTVNPDKRPTVFLFL
jgi:16S rRNA (cytidine1402-2'-O)-methyltransferase